MSIPSILDPSRTEGIEFSNDEIARYSHHLIMPEVTLEGQKKLKAAKILCIGTGGLGSPIALYLAAAGVGTLGLVDFDVVDYSNLQRQILHGTKDVGRKKLNSARDRLFNVVDLVDRLETETGNGKQGRIADYLTRLDFIIFGELGYLPFAQAGGQFLFHLISRL